MVMKLTPNLEETTVQGIDMKCFLIGSSVMLILKKDVSHVYLNILKALERVH